MLDRKQYGSPITSLWGYWRLATPLVGSCHKIVIILEVVDLVFYSNNRFVSVYSLYVVRYPFVIVVLWGVKNKIRSTACLRHTPSFWVLTNQQDTCDVVRKACGSMALLVCPLSDRWCQHYEWSLNLCARVLWSGDISNWDVWFVVSSLGLGRVLRHLHYPRITCNGFELCLLQDWCRGS